MPVDSKSEFYKTYIDDWSMIRTILQGERSIKTAGETYCPKLTGQTPSQYSKYLQRGNFYNAFARTVSGYSGALIRKPASVSDFPEDLEPYRSDLSLTGITEEEITKEIVTELLGPGYMGVLIDFDVEAMSPYCTIYAAENILNFKIVNKQLVMLVLFEYVESDGVDEYEVVLTEQIRVLYVSGNQVVSRIYQKIDVGNRKTEWVLVKNDRGEEETVLRTIGGRPLPAIPFEFVGAGKNSYYPSKPPLLDLAYLNIRHWQLTVEYNYGLHYCALPTPYAFGIEAGGKFEIGPTKALTSRLPEAHCGYMEFTGQGLSAVRQALKDYELQMAILGGRLLEEQKRQTEAADSFQARASGDFSTLSSLASSTENALERVYWWFAVWKGNEAKAEKLTVTLNRDFVSARLGAQDLTALLQALQSSSISIETFLYNLQAGEILPPDRTIDDEKDLIAAQSEKNGEFEEEPPPPKEEEEGEEEE